jgi:hypothetical protein
MTWLITPSFTPWTPALITTALWLDAADASTVTASGGVVGQWSDKSGNGRNFTASGAAQPTYTSSGLNGLPILTFNGANYLTSASANATWGFLHNGTTYTTAFVVKFGSSGDPNAVYGLIGTNGGASANIGMSFYWDDRSSLPRNDNFLTFITAGGGVISILQDNNNSLSANTPQLITALANPSSITPSLRMNYRINGGTEYSNNTQSGNVTSADPTYAMQIGAIGNNGSPLVGYISELVIVASDITSSTRQKCEGYLAHKWGLTANLPADHPYKVNAPAP